jgi:hypothetical protein
VVTEAAANEPVYAGGMRLAALFASPIFFAASIGSHAQTACDAGTTVRDAARVTAIRNELRAT